MAGGQDAPWGHRVTGADCPFAVAGGDENLHQQIIVDGSSPFGGYAVRGELVEP